MATKKIDLFGKHTKQRDLFNDPAKIKILVCGRGWGKSRLVVYEALRAVMIPKSEAWIVAPTLSSVNEIYFDDLIDTIEILGWSNKVHIDRRSGIFTFDNGSKLYLKSSDRPERLRGRRLDLLALDEFAYFNYKENFQKTFMPLLKPKGKMLITSTPNGYDELFKLYERGQLDKTGVWKSWRYASIDNPTVDWGDQIEIDKKSMSPADYRQERLGMFESMAGKVSVDFDRKVNAVELPIAFAEKQIRISCDFNVDPMCFVASQIISKDLIEKNNIKLADNIKLQSEVLCVIKDWKLKDATTTRMINVLKQWLDEISYTGNLTFYGDASGLQRNTASDYTNWLLIENAFPNAYFSYNTSNPTVTDRINTANMKIKNASNEIGLLIDINRALDTIRDFEQVSYKRGTMQIDKSKERQGIGHLYDATTYAIYELFNLQDEIEVADSFDFKIFDIDTTVVA